MQWRLHVVFVCACSTGALKAPRPESVAVPQDEPTQQQPELGTLPAIKHAVTTVQQTLQPHARGTPLPDNTSDLAARAKYQQEGYGEISKGPGIPYVTRPLYDDYPPPVGANPRRLVRFAHLSDLQLADDESPARTAMLDGTGQTNGAYRPQEGYDCHIVAAAVRTINALHHDDPIDFVLLGGDNMDNAQHNELSYVLGLFRGGAINCDSGADDDPTPGPFNDVKDPFTTEGLLMPTKWVTGNHDILVQGNLPVESGVQAMAIGGQPTFGTRDYRLPGAPVNDLDTPADATRALFDRGGLMQALGMDGDGHGIGPLQQQAGKAFYYFDVPNTPLRFVVLDTSAEQGGADGILHRADVDRFVKPAFDEAVALGKWIVISSHHSLSSLTKDGGTFGRTADDAMLEDDWRAFLRMYPVVFSMVGHTHTHRVRGVQEFPGRGFWEVMTASLVDFPGQFRTIEIFDQDNGWLMLRATCVDYSSEGDPMAEVGRQLMFVDWATGWGLDGTGESHDLNVELWIQKPN